MEKDLNEIKAFINELIEMRGHGDETAAHALQYLEPALDLIETLRRDLHSALSGKSYEGIVTQVNEALEADGIDIRCDGIQLSSLVEWCVYLNINGNRTRRYFAYCAGGDNCDLGRLEDRIITRCWKIWKELMAEGVAS